MTTKPRERRRAGGRHDADHGSAARPAAGAECGGACHDAIYRAARCYDVAFGFRDIGAECDTLSALAVRHGPTAEPPRSMLELAAGPARHAREFARRGAHAAALDASDAMCAYARVQAARDRVELDAACADMRAFDLGRRFELALLAMDSASYLLDNDSVLQHLACVARHLVDHGLYVMEMSHPRDAFGIRASTSNRWTSEDSGLRVEMQWGAEGDAFDPVTQIDDVTVTVDWHDAADGSSGRIVERSHQRRTTANEIDALVRASGTFEIVERLGALDPPVPFGNDAPAWRMVLVLRRLNAPTTDNRCHRMR